MTDRMRELAEDLFPDDPDRRHRPDDLDGDGAFAWLTGLFTSAGLALFAQKYREQIICGIVFVVIVAAYFLVQALQ